MILDFMLDHLPAVLVASTVMVVLIYGAVRLVRGKARRDRG